METANVPIELVDKYGRVHRKLRVSVTDRCNFRCGYCMPDNPRWLPRAELLSFEELRRLLRLFVASLGVAEIRLTGGEPLLRRDLAKFVRRLGALRDIGLRRIALTSNGVLLPRYAGALAAAGLDDINISLDALDPQVFAKMTGDKGSPEQVIAGIDAARAAGLPVKLNAVVVRGYNEEQIMPLLHWAMQRQLPLRFIEFMPLEGGGLWSDERVISETQILATVGREHRIEPVPRGSAPATQYRIDGDYRLGIISTVSNPFCASCDRLRLTATGDLYSCLFSATGRDLRSALRENVPDADLIQIVRGHVWRKQAGYAATGMVERPITMHTLGG